ncbi:MAG: phosphotransferase family protein [Alphaproteobacteria bacterium]
MENQAGSTVADAQRLLRAASPQFAKIDLTPVSASTSNYVYVTSDSSIVRFPHNDWVRDGFQREHKLLSLLNGHLGVSIPRIDLFNETPVFMAYKAIEGMVASRDVVSTLNSERRARFGATLGAFMARLHGEPTEKFDFLPHHYGEELLRQLREDLDSIGSRDPEGRVGGLLQETLETWEDIRNGNDAKVLLHQDLHGQNLICDPETGDLIGVLDFTLAWIGDPLWDFPEVYRCGADILEHTIEVYSEESGRRIDTEAVKIISRLQLMRSLDRAPLNSAREAQVLERIRAHP